MNKVPGNDGLMQEKQGSTAETALEVKADSRRDRFFLPWDSVLFLRCTTIQH
jgi:hypothetical protein